MMTLYLFFLILLLFILGIYWYMPSLMPPTLPFGVRIPPEHSNAPVITIARRDYRIGTLIIGLLSLAIGWFNAQHISLPIGGSSQFIVAFALLSLNYYTAHQKIKRVKAHEHWYEGVRQVVIADTEAHTQPLQLNKTLILVIILLFAITLGIGIVRYPALPEQIPTHFGFDGRPDQWSSRITAITTMPAMELIITALMFWLATITTHIRHQIEPDDPQADLALLRKTRPIISNMLLGIAICTNVTFLFVELLTCSIIPANSAMLIPLLLLPTFSMLVILALALSKITKLRAGMPSRTRTNGTTRVAARDDDRYWPGGLFYVNPDDPAIWVEKRFGIGYTINFGNPRARLLALAFIAIIVISTVLPIIFAH